MGEPATSAHLPITMSRRFYKPWHLERMVQDVRTDAGRRIAPFVSFKLPNSWQEAGSGQEDAWFKELLDLVGAIESTVFLALHHEPENDVDSAHDPEHWVDLQVRARELAGAHAPNITMVPTLMQRTFDPASGRDPASWVVPDAPVFGIDIYNPWRAAGTEPWESFDTIVDRVRRTLPETPLIIPEVGCREDPDDLGRAPAWLQEAFERCIHDDIVGLAYFNSDYNNDDGTLALDGTRLATWKHLLARPEVARPV